MRKISERTPLDHTPGLSRTVFTHSRSFDGVTYEFDVCRENSAPDTPDENGKITSIYVYNDEEACVLRFEER